MPTSNLPTSTTRLSILGALVLSGWLATACNRTERVDTDWLVVINDVFIPVLELSVDADAKERAWSDALAERVNGRAEVRIKHGRVDVVTDSYAIEVDFLKKWHEGLGQAIHYGDATERIGVLALIDNTVPKKKAAHRSRLRLIERLCIEKGIKLILLRTEDGGF